MQPNPPTRVGGHGTSSQKRRLQRACDLCRKKRCDGDSSNKAQCSTCTAFGEDCTYEGPAQKKSARASYVKMLERRVALLEASLQRRTPLSEESPFPSLQPEIRMHTNDNTDHLKYRQDNSHPDSLVNSDEESDDGMEPMESLSQWLHNLELDPMHHRLILGSSSTISLLKDAAELQQKLKIDASTMPSRRSQFWTIDPREAQVFSRIQRAKDGIQYTFPDDDLIPLLVGKYFQHFDVVFPLLHRPSLESSLACGLHYFDPGFAAVVLAVCALGAKYCDDPRVYPPGSSGLDAGCHWFEQLRLDSWLILTIPRLQDLQVYVLSALYLACGTSRHGLWMIVGHGLRLAIDAGVHRKKVYSKTPNLQEELWKRAFWILVILDRISGSETGRPCIIQNEDCDTGLLIECDDEFWVVVDADAASSVNVAPSNGQGADANRLFFALPREVVGSQSESAPTTERAPVKIQVPAPPPNTPSKISFFNWFIQLEQIHAFALRTLFWAKAPSSIFGLGSVSFGTQTVVDIDSAMNQWLESLPSHLKWDPNRQHSVFLHQSAILHSMFYHLQVVVHRSFVAREASVSLPSRAICTNAARANAHVLKAIMNRTDGPMPIFCVAAFTSAMVMILNMMSRPVSQIRGNPGAVEELEDIKLCLASLKVGERCAVLSGQLLQVYKTFVSTTSLIEMLSDVGNEMATTLENLIHGTTSAGSEENMSQHEAPLSFGTRTGGKDGPNINRFGTGPSAQTDNNLLFGPQLISPFSFDRFLDTTSTSRQPTEVVDGPSNAAHSHAMPQPDFLSIWANDPFEAFSSAAGGNVNNIMQFSDFGAQGGC